MSLAPASAEPITADPAREIPDTLLTQSWLDLSFLHWAADPADVAPLLPPGTVPDTLDGITYIGLVAFRMHRVGWFKTPGIPYLGTFPETNVRLYSVDHHGRRGVVFRSLEASRLLPVAFARSAFRLPYTWARMTIHREGDTITYSSRRRWPGPRGARSRITVRIGGADRGAHSARALPDRPLGHAQRFLWPTRVPTQHPPALAAAPRGTPGGRGRVGGRGRAAHAVGAAGERAVLLGRTGSLRPPRPSGRPAYPLTPDGPCGWSLQTPGRPGSSGRSATAGDPVGADYCVHAPMRAGPVKRTRGPVLGVSGGLPWGGGEVWLPRSGRGLPPCGRGPVGAPGARRGTSGRGRTSWTPTSGGG